MKSIIIFLFLVLLTLTGCEGLGNESIVDNPGDTQVGDLSFRVDTTYLDSQNKRLVASGQVKNYGSGKITAPWYVEGQFYTSSTSNVKLGGNYTQISVPLSPGQQTYWTIYFSSNNTDVRQYPNFAIRDIRAVYK